MEKIKVLVMVEVGYALPHLVVEAITPEEAEYMPVAEVPVEKFEALEAAKAEYFALLKEIAALVKE